MCPITTGGVWTQSLGVRWLMEVHVVLVGRNLSIVGEIGGGC